MRILALTPMAIAALAGAATAQTVFTQWNFNSLPTSSIVNNPAPSLGRGTAVPLGMTNNYTFSLTPPITGSITTCDVTGAGASGDTASSPNNCWRVRGSYDGTLTHAGVGWSIHAPQFTQGAEFRISTVNYANLVFTFDWFTTNQGVHNMQVQYSVNGGASWISTGPILASATNGWVNDLTFDFTSIPAANDNPNFRVRLVSVYDPTYTGPGAPTYTGASGGQYNNASGNWRFDRVTFTGTAIRAVGPAVVTSGVNPPAVCSSGGPLTFTVAVQGGANPPSTGLAVSADLSALGLNANQAFYDDGTNGDVQSGDGIFTYAATVPAGRPLTPVSITANVIDAQSRATQATIPVSVGDCSGNSAARVVISQTFGGGGNLGAEPAQDAPYDADYVQLYNRSAQPVLLDGWSVQYASQASITGFDSTGDQVLLSGTIQPGQSLLIRMSDPVPGFTPLPTPDFAQLAGFGGMGNSGGRVALVRSTSLIGTNYNDPSIEDFVGYGSGTITFEGVAPTPSPIPSSNTAVIRKSGGNQDTQQNFNDFITGAPSPSNRATGGFLAGFPAESDAAACSGTDVLFTVGVSPGAGSTGITVFADVSQVVGGPATAQLFDDGTHGDEHAGDRTYSLNYTIPASAAQGNRRVGFVVADQQGGRDVSSLPLAVGNCSNSTAPVVISQVYGGGGNDGSGFNGDFAEIFNRSGAPVNLTGWSFQSARITDLGGFANRIALLSGVINPGEYRLIIANQLSSTGAALPPADFVPSQLFGMESSFGRVVLVSSTNFVGTDYNRSDVVDLVGYGSATPSYEGVGPTGTLSDILVAVRKEGGCQDTNQNAIDFDVVLALQLPNNQSSPANVCPGAPTCGCAADYNADGGVDGSDIEAFYTDWESSIGCADVNQDGGIDGSDVEAFFLVWEAGGC